MLRIINLTSHSFSADAGPSSGTDRTARRSDHGHDGEKSDRSIAMARRDSGNGPTVGKSVLDAYIPRRELRRSTSTTAVERECSYTSNCSVSCVRAGYFSRTRYIHLFQYRDIAEQSTIGSDDVPEMIYQICISSAPTRRTRKRSKAKDLRNTDESDFRSSKGIWTECDVIAVNAQRGAEQDRASDPRRGLNEKRALAFGRERRQDTPTQVERSTTPIPNKRRRWIRLLNPDEPESEPGPEFGTGIRKAFHSDEDSDLKRARGEAVRSDEKIARSGNPLTPSDRLVGKRKDEGSKMPFRAFLRWSDSSSELLGLSAGGKEIARGTILLIPRCSARTSSLDHPVHVPAQSMPIGRHQEPHTLPSAPKPTNYFLPSPLSSLPPSTPLTALLLPGTHQSLARRGWPFSQCQEKERDVERQLRDGVRCLDVRLNLVEGELVGYHGPFPQHSPFALVLSQISTFLLHNPLETLILCIQQEAGSRVSPLFSQAVREEMQPYIENDEWFLESRVPCLGEVRGKGVLMSRFGGGAKGEGPWAVEVDYVPPEKRDGSEGDEVYERLDEEHGSLRTKPDGRTVKRVVRMGWKPNRWPDSKLEGFTWDCGPRTKVDTQDWYDISGWFNIPAKFEVIRAHLEECARDEAEEENGSLMCMSFASAASVPFALPQTVAKGFGWPRWGLGMTGVNERLRNWLLDRLEREIQAGLTSEEQDGRRSGLRGIVPMDFYSTGGLADIMHAFNRV